MQPQALSHLQLFGVARCLWAQLAEPSMLKTKHMTFESNAQRQRGVTAVLGYMGGFEAVGGLVV